MSTNDEVQDGMVRQTLADRKAKPSLETKMDLLGGEVNWKMFSSDVKNDSYGMYQNLNNEWMNYQMKD